MRDPLARAPQGWPQRSLLPLPLLLLLAAAALAACGAVEAASDAAQPDAVMCPVCDPNATCQDATCVCNSGYSGTGEVCTDIDECQTNNGGCDANAFCGNEEGSRRCDCKSGFVGNGVSCQPIWVLVNSTPGVDPDPAGFGAKATGVGNLLLFGADGNDDTTQYMRAFDPTTSTVTPKLALPPSADSDFCACGFTDVFVGAGVGTVADLYMLGNYGYRYAPGGNLWTLVPPYLDPFRRGEAAAAFDPTNQLLWIVGGRDNESTAVTMTVPGQVFASSSGVVPFPVDQAKAWVFSGDGLLYVAGGFGGTRKHLASRHPTSGVWTMLPEAPVPLGPVLGMGEFQGRLWVATSSSLELFRPSTGQWEASVAVPPGFVAAAVAGEQTYALCRGADALEVHRLAALP